MSRKTTKRCGMVIKKNIFIIIVLFLCLCGCFIKCAEVNADNKKKGIELEDYDDGIDDTSVYDAEKKIGGTTADDAVKKITNVRGCGDTEVIGHVSYGGEDFVRTAGTATYNCCPPNNVKCVRWICGSAAQFSMAYDNSHSGSGFNNDMVSTCKNSSGTVCWVGQLEGANGGMGVVNTNQITVKGNDSYTINLGTGGYGMPDSLKNTKSNYLNANPGMTEKTMAYFCDELTEEEEIKEEPEDKCEKLKSLGGTTDVISGVHKQDEGDYNWAEYGFVWAYPGESISFKDCYYSGLQTYRNRQVTPLTDDDGKKIETWKAILRPKGVLTFGDECANDPTPSVGCNSDSQWKSRHGAESKKFNSPATMTLKQTLKKEWGQDGWDNGFDVVGLVSTSQGGAAWEDENPKKHEYEDTYSVGAFDVGIPEGVVVSASAKVYGGTELIQTVKSRFLDTQYNMPRVYEDDPHQSWQCWRYCARHEGGCDTYDNSDCEPEYTSGAASKCSGTERTGSNYLSAEQSSDHKPHNYVYWVSYSSEMSTCQTAYLWNEFNFYGGPAMHTSGILVPYNYENHGEAKLSGERIYAGEKTPQEIIGIAVTTPRYNPVTRGNYATIAPNSSWAVMGYISADSDGSSNRPDHPGACGDKCEVYASGGGMTFNPNGNTGGDSIEVFRGGPYNLWDTEAGNYFCVVTVVSSATSGEYTNMSPFGDGAWNSSSPACRIISKKPTFQIRGGGLYIESGKVGRTAETSKKNNVEGQYSYSKEGYISGSYTSNYYSWVDQSSTIAKTAEFYKFASGAAINKKSTNSYVEDDVTSKTSSFSGLLFSVGVDEKVLNSRKFQPLTLPTPNIVAASNRLDGIGTTLNTSFKSVIVNTLMNGNSSNPNTQVISSCNISGISLEKGKRAIINCNGDLTIGGNIQYTGSLDKIADVPVAIIHANNITISPNVTRIDGWLITDNTLNTCSGNSNVLENPACKNSLTINGPVVAHTILLNRTYGNGAGYRSTYPAELFNLSTATYLYSAAGSREMNPSAMQNVYTRELAPRY